MYPDWLRAYMDYSSHSEAPDKFHFWTAVSTIAGALQRKVYIDQGYFQWTPNFYIILVAPPGIVNKSTTISIGMALLHQVGGIKFGPDAVTWQALTAALAESTEGILQEDGSYFPMSCLTIASSEFGSFLNPKDREMIDVLVDLWDGKLGVWEKRTKTQGSDKIENPWINLIACTTPAWLAGNFPEYMIGGGFTSRCVFVYGERKRRLVTYPGLAVPKNFKEEGMRLARDLEHISLINGEYTLHKDAIAFGEEWYEAHNTRAPGILDNEKFAGYLARKQTHVHKLAIVIAAARKDERIVLRDELEAATKIITALEADMPKVFAMIGETEETRYAQQLVQLVRVYKSIERTALYKLVFKTMSYQNFENGLIAGVHGGFLCLRQFGNEQFVQTPEYKMEVPVAESDAGTG